MTYQKSIFVILLAVHLLTVLFIPCIDMEISSSGGRTVVSHQTSTGCDSNKQLCCSVCHCITCKCDITLPMKNMLFFPISVVITDANLILYQSLRSDYLNSIWQPPQELGEA